ncbi:MAG: hypothetical protein PUB42_01955 [Firmicutes bacterium]|nr:hypothetical protein [Bacillota bacterium]
MITNEYGIIRWLDHGQKIDNIGIFYKMGNNFKYILTHMALDDKIAMLTEFYSVDTKPLEQCVIPEKIMAEWPHGICAGKKINNTYFPSTVCITSMCDTASAEKAEAQVLCVHQKRC